MSKFSLEDESLLKQVFPPNLDFNITSVGHKGFNVTQFSALYPRDLNIFIPYDYVTNKISNAIPAEFESFFKSLDDYLGYVSRLVEVKNVSNLYSRGAEYAVGQIAHLTYRAERSATFTLRPHGSIGGSLNLLCRMKVVNGDDTSILTNMLSGIAAEFKPDYIDTAANPKSPNSPYIYWGIRPSQVFSNPELIFAALMASTPEAN